MTSVVVTGSVNVDALTVCDQFPRPGETVLGSAISFLPGGKGGNQARAAALAGAHTTLIAAVGTDAAATTVLDSLRASGVHAERLHRIPGSTGFANVTVNGAGENQIVVVPGANARLGLDDADRTAIAAADVLLVQLEVPLAVVIEAAQVARSHGTAVVLNASPVRSLPTELTAALDAVVVNRAEAAQLGTAITRVPLVITTLGADGATANLAPDAGRAAFVAVPGFRVDAVDTTGAGDAFAGALAANWHLPLTERLTLANAAGALSTQIRGAAAPTASEITTFVTRQRAINAYP